MPFDGRRGASAAPLITLDALAESLLQRPADGEAPALFRWAEHEARRGGCGGTHANTPPLSGTALTRRRARAQSVHILRFASGGAQKAALTRLSLFLEDKAHRGTVLAAVPTGSSAMGTLWSLEQSCANPCGYPLGHMEAATATAPDAAKRASARAME